MAEVWRKICGDDAKVWEDGYFSTCFLDSAAGAAVDLFVWKVLLGIQGLALCRGRLALGPRRRTTGRLSKLLIAYALGLTSSVLFAIQAWRRRMPDQSVELHSWAKAGFDSITWVLVAIAIETDYRRKLAHSFWLCLVCVYKSIAETLIAIGFVRTRHQAGHSQRVWTELWLTLLVAALAAALLSWRKDSQAPSSDGDSLTEPLVGDTEETADDRQSAEELLPWSISWYQRLIFQWATPVLATGATRPLQEADMFELGSALQPLNCAQRLSQSWQTQSPKQGQYQLLWAIVHAYGHRFFPLGLIKLANDALAFVAPLLLHALLTLLASEGANITSDRLGSASWQGYGIAAALGITALLRGFLGTQYSYLLSCIMLQLRASMTCVVYQKAVKVSLAERSRFSTGQVQTLMAVDVQQLTQLCYFHDLWGLPLQLFIALYLLYRQVHYAFLAGVAVVTFLIPVNRWLAQKIGEVSKQMMAQKDTRIRIIGEILAGIRAVKMYVWEACFMRRINEVRDKELHNLAVRKYLDAMCVYFWSCTPILFSLFTFGAFALLGHPLDAATVFTSLTLFNVLIVPLNAFPWVINGMVEGAVSLKRLQEFLRCPDLQHIEPGSDYPHDHGYGYKGMSSDVTVPTNGKGVGSNATSVDGEDMQTSHAAVFFQGASCSWDSSCADSPSERLSDRKQREPAHRLCLHHLRFAIPAGSLTMIIGEVGSGKSSLLLSILKELKVVEGNILSYGNTAYVPQVPWLHTGTLRDNVLFGADYDANRYQQVLKACCLDDDLRQMPKGDLSEIGERGYNLSGGQKARVALARAVYQQRAQILLLDDPLSAVDAHVAARLFRNVICGPLLAGKTCILCTHHLQYLAHASFVVALEGGSIAYAGLQPSQAAAHISFSLQNNTRAVSLDEACLDEGSGNLPISDSPNKELEESQPSERESQSQPEEREVGAVHVDTYKTYATAVGLWLAWMVLISIMLMQVSKNLTDWWLSYWVSHEPVEVNKGVPRLVGSFAASRLVQTGWISLTNVLATAHDSLSDTTKFYLTVFAALAVINSICTLARSFFFAYGGLRAARVLHLQLLQAVLAAPMKFFENNPSGRILNRFSSDQSTVDDSLPFIINIFFANAIGLAGLLLILCYTQPLFAFTLLPLALYYRSLQKYYRNTSRDVRRIASVSRSPIYATFAETLAGAATIRGFNAQDRFVKVNEGLVASNVRAQFTETAITQWLALRLQLLAAAVVSVMALLAAASWHIPLRPHLTAGLVGLGLAYALPITGLLNGLLTTFTETEKEMVSVERLRPFLALEPEAVSRASHVPPSSWPAAGELVFDKVTLRYAPAAPPALVNLSFHIRGRERIGLVGRTGAGKSSILSVLFQMVESEFGTVLLDGVDISSVPLHRLRSSIGIIPQSSFLFQGSVRDNLNPTASHSDGELWSVLRKCHIENAVRALGSGLDSQISEGGMSLSVGQQQLLCLARVMLRRVQVLCMDECTANVDPATSVLLQETLDQEFANKTVITIAHRIATVLACDRVLVLHEGKLVEEGPPGELMKDASSAFAALARAH
eukprot:jgi/Chlat1/2047/Chrsp17S02516